jgi:hypothetical protein
MRKMIKIIIYLASLCKIETPMDAIIREDQERKAAELGYKYDLTASAIRSRVLAA